MRPRAERPRVLQDPADVPQRHLRHPAVLLPGEERLAALPRGSALLLARSKPVRVCRASQESGAFGVYDCEDTIAALAR